MKKRLVLIVPQEAKCSLVRRGLWCRERGIFSERLLGDPLPGCFVSSVPLDSLHTWGQV